MNDRINTSYLDKLHLRWIMGKNRGMNHPLPDDLMNILVTEGRLKLEQLSKEEQAAITSKQVLEDEEILNSADIEKSNIENANKAAKIINIVVDITQEKLLKSLKNIKIYFKWIY